MKWVSVNQKHETKKIWNVQFVSILQTCFNSAFDNTLMTDPSCTLTHWDGRRALSGTSAESNCSFSVFYNHSHSDLSIMVSFTRGFMDGLTVQGIPLIHHCPHKGKQAFEWDDSANHWADIIIRWWWNDLTKGNSAWEFSLMLFVAISHFSILDGADWWSVTRCTSVKKYRGLFMIWATIRECKADEQLC